MRLLILLATAAFAFAQKPILEHSFESGEDGWMAMGNNTSVKSAPGGAVTASKSALAFRYRVEANQPAIAVVPVQSPLTGMKALRFWLKTDHATPVAVLLSETKPGGDYTAVVWSPGNVWQEVELTPEDFSLNDGPNDPKDEDGKLDLDKIQGLGVMDLSVFALSIGKTLPVKVDNVRGDHTLWLDEVRIEGAAPAPPPGVTLIDNLERKTLQWLALGGATLNVVSSSPLQRRALELQYEQSATAFVIFLRRIAHVNLSYSSGITVELASEKPAHVILTLEEKVPDIAKPVRFNFTIELPGGRQAVKKQLPFKEFELAEDMPANAPSRVDPAYVRTLSLADLKGLVGGAAGANTLWVSGLAAYK